MNKRWKALIVVALAVAVLAVVNSKRHAAQTPAASSSTTTSSSCTTAGCSVASLPTAPAPAKKTQAAPPSTTGVPAKSGPKASPQVKSAPVPGGVAAKQAAPAAKPKALPQMVELGSKTCTPCQMMQPILGELRKEYKGQLEVPFWDIYEHPEKSRAYRIRVIPTQVFLGADGKEVFRHEGFFPKADIVAKFKELGIVLRGAR